jgi:hypothetical protein
LENNEVSNTENNNTPLIINSTAGINCKEGFISEEIYNLGEINYDLTTSWRIDSFLMGYNLQLDTTPYYIDMLSGDTSWMALRRYWKLSQDSSYFTFRTRLFKNEGKFVDSELNYSESKVIYTLLQASITDNKLNFLNGLHIGISRDSFRSLVSRYVDGYDSHTQYGTFVSCDTVSVHCDGLCGDCLFLFKDNKLVKIQFSNVDYEF